MTGVNRAYRKFALFIRQPQPVTYGNDFLTMSAPQPVDFGDRQTTERLGRKEPNMLIIGCDYQPGFQQIAFVDTDTGDCGERRLEHMEGAEQFYRDLCARGIAARIGLEASGYSRWFAAFL